MSKAMIYTTWDEYYKSRVRNNEYRDAFRLKYGLFLKEIIFNIKRLAQELGTPVILKEEGCGIGTVSLSISSMEEKLLGSMGLTSVSETKEVSKVIFSDISPVMLGLCHENTCPIYSGGYLGSMKYKEESFAHYSMYRAVKEQHQSFIEKWVITKEDD